MIGGSSSRKRAVLVGEIEPGAVLKIRQRTAVDLPGVQQLIELAQGRLGVGTFEIVVGAEKALTAGLALAAGDRTQSVEAPRDRREEALLALDVGRDRPEHRRLLLIGAVRAPQSLDGSIGAPAGFEQVMDALPLVLAGEVGVIAAPGAAGVGEDQNALVVVHEGGGLGKIRGSGTGLDAQAIVALDDAPRAPGDLGDEIGAEAVQDLIERALDRRQGRKMLDHVVAPLDGLPRNDRIAVGVISGARADILLVVGVELEQLGRERVAQIVEYVFPRSNVDRKIAPFRDRDFGEAAVEQGFVGRDDLEDNGVALIEIARDRGDQRRAFHRC